MAVLLVPMDLLERRARRVTAVRLVLLVAPERLAQPAPLDHLERRDPSVLMAPQ